MQLITVEVRNPEGEPIWSGEVQCLPRQGEVLSINHYEPSEQVEGCDCEENRARWGGRWIVESIEWEMECGGLNGNPGEPVIHARRA